MAMAPSVPAGWSISAQGVPIDPAGVAHLEMVGQMTPGAAGLPSDLPLASMAVVGAVGYFLGKPRGQANLWAAVGAGLGYYFKPIG
jgi:hypothetical protein